MSDSFRILCVEDNAETRLLLEHQLSGSFEITFATKEEEALEVIDSKSFDLLLLDINLQAENGGIRVLRSVREREDVPTPPAVALTAFVMPDDREKILEEGFDAYVPKPFTKPGLLSTIEETLA